MRTLEPWHPEPARVHRGTHACAPHSVAPFLLVVGFVLTGLLSTVGCSSDDGDDGQPDPGDTPGVSDTSSADSSESDSVESDSVDSDSVDSDSGLADTGDSGDTSGDSGHPTLAYDVDALGPFGVGYRTISHTYTTPGLGEERTIDINIWYPTEATEGEHPLYEGLFLDEVAIIDAPLAAPVASDGYPVHVHSHGHLGFGGSSANLMRYFASHGWVALAPDHTGNTLSDSIDPRPTALYLWRSMDITATLDFAESLPETDPLAGLLRTQKVVMSGHSFGVHTCWASAGATFPTGTIADGCEANDPFPNGCTNAEVSAFSAGVGDVRIAASIPMAGSIKRDLFGEGGHSSVTIPMLAMSGSNDPVGAEVQFDTTEGVDLTWIDLEGGCHQTFGIGDCATLDVPEGFAIVNTYAMAFARAHVLGDDSATTGGILDGTTTVSSKVTFKRHD